MNGNEVQAGKDRDGQDRTLYSIRTCSVLAKGAISPGKVSESTGAERASDCAR